jgi:hypothetical protein
VTIVITANGYPDIAEEVELTEQELKLRLDSGELWLCTAGCNDSGMNDDPPIYHAKDDYRS